MEKITDAYYESQWNLKLMNVPFAWDISMGEGATIGLFDSGVDASHKDLGWDTDIFLTSVDSESARKAKYQPVLNVIKAGKHPKILSGWNVIADNDDTYDDYRHGTSLAGIMVADIDGEGIVGVAPKSKIRPYKVIDNRGWGYQDKVAEAVADAIDDRVNVMNFSLAWDSEDCKGMTDNIKEAIKQGIIVCCAVGNNNKEKIMYPASIEGVIRVGGCNAVGKRWVHNTKLGSNYGDGMTFLAPADSQITTQYMRSRYEPKEGTSMACANASGVMALVKAVRPAIDNKDILRYYEQFAFDKDTGHGILNAYDLLTYFTEQPHNDKLQNALILLDQLKTAILELQGTNK